MIGRGGFGRVYRALWKTINCPIAVKFLNKRFWHHQIAVRALIEESQKAQRISHRHIIRHHGWGQAPSGAPFLVMDLVKGPNLTDWIHDPSFEVSEVESCATQICDALVALHQAGILHVDISPGNVLRRAPHDFVLTDFGFSRSSGDTHPARGGTPGFLAPEQLSSAFGAISERTDIYGFGALLYFLATGHAPFEGDNESDVLNQVLSSRGPALIPDHCRLPSTWIEIISKCLSKVPSQRGTTMSSVRKDFFRT
jgi:serine/threonine protein kinase